MVSPNLFVWFFMVLEVSAVCPVKNMFALVPALDSGWLHDLKNLAS